MMSSSRSIVPHALARRRQVVVGRRVGRRTSGARPLRRPGGGTPSRSGRPPPGTGTAAGSAPRATGRTPRPDRSRRPARPLPGSGRTDGSCSAPDAEVGTGCTPGSQPSISSMLRRARTAAIAVASLRCDGCGVVDVVAWRCTRHRPGGRSRPGHRCGPSRAGRRDPTARRAPGRDRTRVTNRSSSRRAADGPSLDQRRSAPLPCGNR